MPAQNRSISADIEVYKNPSIKLVTIFHYYRLKKLRYLIELIWGVETNIEKNTKKKYYRYKYF